MCILSVYGYPGDRRKGGGGAIRSSTKLQQHAIGDGGTVWWVEIVCDVLKCVQASRDALVICMWNEVCSNISTPSYCLGHLFMHGCEGLGTLLSLGKAIQY